MQKHHLEKCGGGRKKFQQSTPKTEINEPSTSHGQPTSYRQSQRSKRKPNWYGQNIMVSKVEEEEKDHGEQTQSETKSKKIRNELEEMPIFFEMSQKK